MQVKKRKFWVIILLVLVVSGAGYYFLFDHDTERGGDKQSGLVVSKPEKQFLLEGYPLETVPLYEEKMISSSKFFVNVEPANYYNIVFETTANQVDFLRYYKGMMSEVDEEMSSSERVEGKIGKYRVQVSHYGDNPKNYGYLQVYLPVEEYQKDNPYYSAYPKVIELEMLGEEQESSYGLLNQSGGEVEYTQYFLLPKTEGEQEALIKLFQEKYRDQVAYSYDEKTKTMKWKSGEYAVTVVFSTSHGRVYIMIRQPMGE